MADPKELLAHAACDRAIRELNDQIAALTAKAAEPVGESYMVVPESCPDCGRFLSLSCSVHGEVPT